MEHLTIEQLRDFAAGRSGREQAHLIVAHLLRGCRQCREETSRLNLLRLDSGRESAVPEVNYDGAFERAQERALALFDEQTAALAALPAHEAIQVVDDYLARSWSSRYEDAAEMLRLAREAVQAAESLPWQGVEGRLAADLQCRAWAHFANALRVVGQYPEAENALERAAGLLDEGTGSSELKAQVYDFRASLYGAQRRFQPCWAALDMVFALHREAGRGHLAGRALISKAVYKGYAGDCHEALQLSLEGLKLIDPEGDPDLVLLAIQNQLCMLVECGRAQEARELLDRRRPVWGKDGLNELKLRWLEGRIAAELGELPNARYHLWAARQGFEAAELHHRAALVALDLGTVFLRQGQPAEARQLLLRAVDTLLSLQQAGETLAAAEIFRRALEIEATPIVLLFHLLELLRRLTGDPISRPELLMG